MGQEGSFKESQLDCGLAGRCSTYIDYILYLSIYSYFGTVMFVAH